MTRAGMYRKFYLICLVPHINRTSFCNFCKFWSPRLRRPVRTHSLRKERSLKREFRLQDGNVIFFRTACDLMYSVVLLPIQFVCIVHPSQSPCTRRIAPLSSLRRSSGRRFAVTSARRVVTSPWTGPLVGLVALGPATERTEAAHCPPRPRAPCGRISKL